MSGLRVGTAGVFALATAAMLAAACGFAPDLTRFGACDEGGRCGVGLTCILPERRCIPDCLDCAAPEDGGDDAGFGAGFDGGDDAGVDSGTDAGGNAGPDAGPDDEPDAGGGDAGTEEDAGVDVDPLAIAPTLPYGVEGVPYSQQVSVEGGTGPYLFSPVAASVPAPMTWDADGTLSGTPPSVSGANPLVFVLEATVTDSTAPALVEAAAVSWSVHPVLRFAGPIDLADAVAGSSYLERISAHGGIPPYTYAIQNGAFPTGFTMTPEGVVQGSSGALTALASVLIQVLDSASPPQTATGTVNFRNNTFLTMQITTRSLPSGRVGQPYSYQLQASPGARADGWQLKEGTLPGLTLSATGLISGQPNQTGTFGIKVQIMDSSGLLPHSRELTLVIH